MNILKDAIQKVLKEERTKNTNTIDLIYDDNITLRILDRMYAIRKYMDLQERNIKVAQSRKRNKKLREKL